MREIKFRAWDKESLEWLTDYDTGDYSTIELKPGKTVVIQKELKDSLINGEHEQLEDYNYIGEMVEIMQYTGLKDKNGEDVFEGDILELDDIRCPVTFEDGAFQMITSENQGRSNAIQMRVGRFEVIGNIYENPELLENG